MGLLAALLLFSFAALLFMARRAGKKEEALDKEEEINRAVLKAALYRDRLDHDPYYARRVRGRFTRKLLPDVRTGLFRKEGHGNDKTPDRPE